MQPSRLEQLTELQPNDSVSSISSLSQISRGCSSPFPKNKSIKINKLRRQKTRRAHHKPTNKDDEFVLCLKQMTSRDSTQYLFQSETRHQFNRTPPVSAID